MREESLYYVAVPCTDYILNLITFFSIELPKNVELAQKRHGLFMYSSGLQLEQIDYKRGWILEGTGAEQVLALYANQDFNSICEYLNALPERPFNVFINQNFLDY